jgi:hypothetical protein
LAEVVVVERQEDRQASEVVEVEVEEVPYLVFDQA